MSSMGMRHRLVQEDVQNPERRRDILRAQTAQTTQAIRNSLPRGSEPAYLVLDDEKMSDYAGGSVDGIELDTLHEGRAAAKDGEKDYASFDSAAGVRQANTSSMRNGRGVGSESMQGGSTTGDEAADNSNTRGPQHRYTSKHGFHPTAGRTGIANNGSRTRVDFNDGGFGGKVNPMTANRGIQPTQNLYYADKHGNRIQPPHRPGRAYFRDKPFGDNWDYRVWQDLRLPCPKSYGHEFKEKIRYFLAPKYMARKAAEEAKNRFAVNIQIVRYDYRNMVLSLPPTPSELLTKEKAIDDIIARHRNAEVAALKAIKEEKAAKAQAKADAKKAKLAAEEQAAALKKNARGY